MRLGPTAERPLRRKFGTTDCRLRLWCDKGTSFAQRLNAAQLTVDFFLVLLTSLIFYFLDAARHDSHIEGLLSHTHVPCYGSVVGGGVCSIMRYWDLVVCMKLPNYVMPFFISTGFASLFLKHRCTAFSSLILQCIGWILDRWWNNYDDGSGGWRVNMSCDVNILVK